MDTKSNITRKQHFALIALGLYFGFSAIPPLFLLFSPQFLAWMIILPVVLVALIAFGLWGLIGWLKSRSNVSGTRSDSVARMKVSGLGLLVFVLSIPLAYGTQHLYRNRSFDPNIWNDPRSDDYVPYNWTPRQRMLNDLTTGILPGMTREEVAILLGPPSETGKNYDLGYILGPERGLGVDMELLLIWFDDAGLFEGFAVSRG